MEEKTEQLRDIFLSVSEEATVTESQTASRGSLTDEGASVERRLGEVIDRLREKFGFETPLRDRQRCELVRRFYDGHTDRELASELGCEQGTVFAARMELHLVRDDEPPLEDERLDRVRENPAADPGELAETVGADERAVRRTRAVVQAQERSRRTSQRFTTAYREILTDAGLTTQFAVDTHDDGLADATEGAETDVEF